MLFTIIVLFALATSQISCAPTNDEDASTIEGTPCLGKESGAMVPHPTNKHKYLRCVDDLTLWIETCNDNLYFNPDVNLCDWNFHTVSTTTFRTNLAVKSHAVLFKSKITPEQIEAIRQAKKLRAQQHKNHHHTTTTMAPVEMTTGDAIVEESTTPMTTTIKMNMGRPTPMMMNQEQPMATEPRRIGLHSSMTAGRK